MTKTETKKVPPKVFFERDGYKSPVLRKKNGESDSEFVERMTKLGFTNVETVGYHVRPDSNDVHVGKLDGCVYCARAAKRKDAKVAPKSTKPDVSNTDASTADEKSTDQAVADTETEPNPKQQEAPLKKEDALEEAEEIKEAVGKASDEAESIEEPTPTPKKRGRGRPRKNTK